MRKCPVGSARSHVDSSTPSHGFHWEKATPSRTSGSKHCSQARNKRPASLNEITLSSPPSAGVPAPLTGTVKPKRVEYAHLEYFCGALRGQSRTGCPGLIAVTSCDRGSVVSRSFAPATVCTLRRGGSGNSSARQNGCVSGSASGSNAFIAQYGEPGEL